MIIVEPTADIVIAAEDYVRQIFEQKIPSHIYVYHNWVHTCQVRDEVLLLARQAGVANGELEILNLATIFHDAGFSEAYTGHEAYSIQLAQEFLNSVGYPSEKIKTISALIEATQVDLKPRNLLEALLKDADTSSLGKSHFHIYSNSLRKELNTIRNAALSKLDWAKENLQFMRDHEYYSDAGKERYDKVKAENIKLIEAELEQLEHQEAEKINKVKRNPGEY